MELKKGYNKGSNKKPNKNNMKLEIIDKILQMYPHLKKEKNNILHNIFGNRREENNNEYVLEKFTHKEISYYRDKNGLIRDVTTDIVGVYEIKDGEYKYYFFNELRELDFFKKKKIIFN